TASFPPTHPLYRRRPIPTQGAKTSFALLCGAKRYRIFGVDLTAIPSLNALTAYTLLAEVGTDGSKFRNIHAFASWACFCPHNKKSGGRVLSAKTRKTANRVNRALRLAAQTLERSTSYLGIFYLKRCARWGRPAGITATAHKLARIIFNMLTTGQAYDESTFAAEEQRQRKHLESSLRRKAAKLGYQLIPLPQTA